MCSVSMIMDYGKTIPREFWSIPSWPSSYEELLRKAKKYDEEHGQADCELDEKRLALKKIAEEMGVEIKFP